MAAGSYDIVIDQGSDFSLGLTLKDSNNLPIDLTLYSARAHLRQKKDSNALAAIFSCIIATPATGKIDMTMSNSITKTLTAGTYYYDLEIYTENDAYVERIVQGKAVVTQEVTR